MKRLLLLICIGLLSLGISNDARASHAAGGEIYYEHIGATPSAHVYRVYLILYRDVSGIAAPTTANICLRSSCFGQSSQTAQILPFVLQPGSDTTAGPNGSIITPELTDCVDATDPNLVVTEAYRYATTFTLPGTCADFTFSYSLSARNPSTNMTTSGLFYIESVLNNTLGPNSSPQFLNPAAKSFCVNTPFIWSQAAVEPDGDSLYYDFGTPLTGGCYAPTPMTFQAGYSRTNPMTTANGIQFNNRTGTLRFTATQPEVDVINITVTEYRFNTTIQQYLVVGTTVRDLQVPVVTGCKVGATNGPQFSTSSFPTQTVNADSIKGFGFSKIGNDSNLVNGQYEYDIPVIDYNCFDNEVNVLFKDGIYCETVSDDGSEFRIIGPDSVARPVIGVRKNCRPDLVTKSIDLLLHKRLDVNGDYFLQIKTGNDGNTLTNKCGFPLAPFFMVIIRVTDCPTPDYKLNNVSVYRDEDIDIDWEIDINSFSPTVFTAWNVLRANMDDQYYILASLNDSTDVNRRSYRDTSLDPIDVDLTQFQYRIQLVQNGTPYPPSNRIFSILLKDTLNPTENGNLYNWTEYIGWDSARYELEYGRFDTVQQEMKWTNYGGPNQGYFDDEYFYPSCEENRDTSGLYAFRVLATDPQNLPPGGFIAESNWLYYEIDCEEPTPDPKPDEPIIPTVFSPNGDGQNDVYKLTTNYQYAEIGIYNRWGKPVLNVSGDPNMIAWDGTDQNSGQKVADGVYYYIIKLKSDLDDGTGNISTESEEHTGSLTIFTNGTR